MTWDWERVNDVIGTIGVAATLGPVRRIMPDSPRSNGHDLNAVVRKPRIIGVTTMPKVEPAGLGNLHVDIPTTLADRQQATVTQGIG
ncbi:MULTISPECIES: hypothetical protein [Streptomyces]|uniref:hypothetical protein n=1 Tax=Streptomyces TaxID=1883 RepID=UPI00343F7891